MKLIIDIPKEVVVAIENGLDYRYDIHTAIAQGIPYIEPITIKLSDEDKERIIEMMRDAKPILISSERPQSVKRRKGTPLEENDSGYNCENWIP